MVFFFSVVSGFLSKKYCYYLLFFAPSPFPFCRGRRFYRLIPLTMRRTLSDQPLQFCPLRAGWRGEEENVVHVQLSYAIGARACWGRRESKPSGFPKQMKQRRT